MITLQVVLDRESINNYTLIITATDGGMPQPRSATANVTILINDENDNSPRFTSGAVLSDSPVTVPEVSRLELLQSLFFFLLVDHQSITKLNVTSVKNIAAIDLMGEHECTELYELTARYHICVNICKA